MSPLKTSVPVGESLWIATLCGAPASLFSNSIVNGVSGRSLQARLLVGDVDGAHLERRALPPGRSGRLAAGAARWRSRRWALGAGVGGFALAILSASQASKSRRRQGVDLEQHDAVAGAAQLRALAAERLAGVGRVDREVELVHPARHDVALEQELRDVEGVDDVLADERQLDVPPAGTYMPPPSLVSGMDSRVQDGLPSSAR